MPGCRRTNLAGRAGRASGARPPASSNSIAPAMSCRGAGRRLFARNRASGMAAREMPAGTAARGRRLVLVEGARPRHHRRLVAAAPAISAPPASTTGSSWSRQHRHRVRGLRPRRRLQPAPDRTPPAAARQRRRNPVVVLTKADRTAPMSTRRCDRCRRCERSLPPTRSGAWPWWW